MDFAARFGQNLAHYRERAQISQEELGVRASLHRTAVGQLERGERVARADTVVKLAGSLSIRPEELLEGLEWTPGGTTIGQLRIRDDHGGGSGADEDRQAGSNLAATRSA